MGVTVAMAEGETLGYLLFVKPVRAGSSYGITKVLKRGQLPAALELAFAYDDHVILEEAIPGFEVGCAVLGSEILTVGEPDEIELARGFLNFKKSISWKPPPSIYLPASRWNSGSSSRPMPNGYTGRWVVRVLPVWISF